MRTKKRVRAPLSYLWVSVMMLSLLCPMLSPVSFAEADPIEIRRVLEITIDKRKHPADSPLIVVGILTIVLAPQTGKFTGDITPAVAFPPDAPPDTEGTPFTSVLFDSINGSLVPHEDVTQLLVDGQIQGRAVNMVVRDVGGGGKHIFALGTTEIDPGDQFESDIGSIAGPAVGPKPREGGDWLATTITPSGEIRGQIGP